MARTTGGALTPARGPGEDAAVPSRTGPSPAPALPQSRVRLGRWPQPADSGQRGGCRGPGPTSATVTHVPSPPALVRVGPPSLSCGDGHGVRAPRVRPTCCPQTHFGRLSHHCWPPSDHDKWRGIPNPASRALGLGLHPTEEPSSDSKPPPSVRTEARGQPRRHLGKRHVLHGPLDSEPGVSRGDGGLWRSFQPEHPKRLRLGAGVQGQAPCGWGRVFGALFISPKK